MTQPTIGRIVIYKTDGRNGLEYDLPAIVTVTPDSHPGDYPDGSANPLPVPDEGHVHLTVFTPGGFGTVIDKQGGTNEELTEANTREELNAAAEKLGIDDPAAFDNKAQLLEAIRTRSFVGATGFTPGSGTYVELNVPFLEQPDSVGNYHARSARWPSRNG